MPSHPFATHLAGLTAAELATLLQSRADLLIRPLPRGFEQLARRLDSPVSLSRALTELDRDLLRVGMAAAMITVPPTPTRLAAFLAAPEDAVRRALGELTARGLAWFEPAEEAGETADESASGQAGGGSGAGGAATDSVVRLPDTLSVHWNAEFAGLRPVAALARNVVIADLRTAVRALGADPAELRKPELAALLAERLSEPRRVAAIIAELPADARQLLTDLRVVASGRLLFPIFTRPGPRTTEAKSRLTLTRAGLLLPVNTRTELPREVAVAAWIIEDGGGLTGPPDIPRPPARPPAVASAAQAGAESALRSVTALVDEAAAGPLAALKRGGIGSRERQRLAKRLALPLAELGLWIDVAATAGLLADTDDGYGPGPRFGAWRDEVPSRQWAALALAWYLLEHAPSARGSESDDEPEVPPPLPIASEAGIIRRALLRAAAGGRSTRLTGENIDWYFPLHGYPPAARDALVAATIGEAELLGVVAVDVLTGLGEALLTEAADLADLAAVAPDTAYDIGASARIDEIAAAAERLGDRCEPQLPATSTSLILQSDLTALVSGQPTATMAHLLRAAAVPESRGAAAIWRFTPASVRTAMDAGWTADDLLGELRALADRALPQALEYLISDVARRHGHLRVRGLRSAILGDEPTLTEVLHTRVLAKLHLARLAPTVLSSPAEPPTVLAELRRAGFSPVHEDSTATIILPAGDNPLGPPSARGGERTTTTGHSRRAAGAGPKAAGRQRGTGNSADTAADAAPGRRVTPEALIEYLRDAERDGIPPLRPLARSLADMNDRLDDSELALLAEAVEQHTDVVIAYRDKNGSRTVRRICPNDLYGRWIDAYCYLRNDDREFTVANIEAVTVAP